MIIYNKIWVGDTRPPKDTSYYWADTVNKAKNCIIYNEEYGIAIEEINISVNGIEKARQADGGNVNDFTKWLKKTNRQYKIINHIIT